MKDHPKHDRDDRRSKRDTSKDQTAAKRSTSKGTGDSGAQQKASPEMERADVANGENRQTGAGS